MITAHYNTIKKAILKEKQDKMYRQMHKDQEEQRKLTGGGKGAQTSRTGRKTTDRSGGVQESKRAKEARDKEEAIQRLVIRDQLSGDPDLQFDNPFICTYMKKL